MVQNNQQSVDQLLAGLSNPDQQRDGRILLDLMHEITREDPSLWGSTIIGFGRHHYRYESGREGDTPIVSFAPRSREFAIYGVLNENDANLTEQLGTYRTGKGCLYVKKLSDINVDVLKKMIDFAYRRKTSAD